MSKFCLVYEPKYSKSQFVIDFKLNEQSKYDFKHIELYNRYSDILSLRNGKHDLLSIDKLTNVFKTENDFLCETKIYRPLYSFFIGYPIKGYVNKLKPVFNNEELSKVISNVSYNKVIDCNLIEEITTLLITDKDFNSFYRKSNYYKTYEINRKLELLAHYERMLELEPDIETSYAYYEIIKNLKSEISKYHVFRELLLAKQEFYTEYKKSEIKTLEIARSETKKEEITKPFYVEEGEQLVLPGFEMQKVKTKNNIN